MQTQRILILEQHTDLIHPHGCFVTARPMIHCDVTVILPNEASTRDTNQCIIQPISSPGPQETAQSTCTSTASLPLASLTCAKSGRHVHIIRLLVGCTAAVFRCMSVEASLRLCFKLRAACMKAALCDSGTDNTGLRPLLNTK